MFTVGLDTSALLPDFKEHRIRGIGRYVGELSKFFEGHQANGISVNAFTHLDATYGAAEQALRILPFGRLTFRQQLVCPIAIASKAFQRFDVLHFPAHMDAPAWGSKKYILTVLDLIPHIFPQLYRANGIRGWRYDLGRFFELKAIKKAALILAISQHTARDLHRLLNIPEEKIRVTPLGVDLAWFQKATTAEDELKLRLQYCMPLSAPIVLYVGGIDQRKNIRFMLEVIKAAKEKAQEGALESPILAMVGRIDQDREYPYFLQSIRELELESSVYSLGYVDDDTLLHFYRAGSLFFFPSLYEGFGLPALEAMAAGCPVVSSNSSCLPEVLGDAALFFDPTHTNDAADKVVAVIENRSLAEELKFRGLKRAELFPWSKTGESTLQAYESLAAGKV